MARQQNFDLQRQGQGQGQRQGQGQDDKVQQRAEAETFVTVKSNVKAANAVNSSNINSSANLPLRPRNHNQNLNPNPNQLQSSPSQSQSPSLTPSPYVRTHLRSRSHASALAPPMARAHSLPSVHSSGHHFTPSPTSSPSLRPSSPMRSLSPHTRQPNSPSLRPSSPFRPRSPLDESHTPLNTYDGSIESISEDAELDITPRAYLDHHNTYPAPSARSLSVRRQRPSSPLHSLGHPTPPRPTSSASSSPSVPPARFNEAFPPLNHHSSNSSFSSMSTTPSSARSRSPSISSLETIEDAPDAEWEAIQSERAAKLRAVAEAAEQGDDAEPQRRASLEIPGQRPTVGFGFGRRGGDANRKRWSICGGERRADLDLETIWED